MEKSHPDSAAEAKSEYTSVQDPGVWVRVRDGVVCGCVGGRDGGRNLE